MPRAKFIFMKHYKTLHFVLQSMRKIRHRIYNHHKYTACLYMCPLDFKNMGLYQKSLAERISSESLHKSPVFSCSLCLRRTKV